MLLLALLPGLAMAGDAPDTDWHRCQTDADCVLVEGICEKAAVNRAYTNQASAFYLAQKKAGRTGCADAFWKLPAKRARCHLESCEVLTN